MTTSEPNDVEKILHSLSPRPVPPGLRAKVLESALRKRQDLVLTPRTWAAAAACTALIAAAVLADAAVSKGQSDDLRSLLNGPGGLRLAEEDVKPLPLDIWRELGDPGKTSLEQAILIRLGTCSASPHDVFEARERLKGWLDYEDEGPESLY